MKKVILWLLFIIAAASAWEDDDYDNDDGICPLAVCHGIYVDTQYDINHCGECDIKCFPNQICINGICTCPNNNNACGATCTACPTGQHCESFDDDYQCVCDNTLGSCGAPGSCSACTGSTPDCINGACTCPNNNNACGTSCTACLTGEHCESFDGGATYQCVCDNTVGSCGSPGSCISCSGATPECINGACMCPNNNNACGTSCTACLTGEHCESFDGGATYQCVCDNTVGSCGSLGSCMSCTGATPECINGACTCPNNNGACTNGNLGPGSCSACTGPNQICDSITGNCICPNTQTACGNNGFCTPCSGATPECINGACTCPNNNNACGTSCTACLTGEHCESFDGGATYQCVCDNTVGSCGSLGSCMSCTGATPDCINGACTCPNNNGACTNGNLGPGSCSACTGPNQICDSITGNCICPNIQTACGNNGFCTDCTLSGASPNSVCADGVCTCPNTATACGAPGSACTTCATNQNCVNGVCECPDSNSACTHGGFGNTKTCAACPTGEYCNSGTCTCFSGTICFDDLPPNPGTTVPNGYGNLNWLGIGTLDGNLYPGSGFQYGIISPVNIAWTGSLGTITSISSTFTPISVYATSWVTNDNIDVVFTAFQGSVQVGTITSSLTNNPILIFFPQIPGNTFTNIDKMTIAKGGTPYFGAVVLDNLVVTFP